MPLRLGEPLPSFDGATQWIHPSALPPSGPVLVHFWAVSCYLCKQNLPLIKQLRREFSPRGLSVIAVHMPRQQEDTDGEAVQRAISEFGIEEPCAIDNNHALKDSFKNEQGWVPAYFLFDGERKLKLRSAGENGASMIEAAVRRLFSVQTETEAPAA